MQNIELNPSRDLSTHLLWVKNLKSLILTIATAAFACSAISSCLVTDEIEFTDEVNYPPVVLKFTPENRLQSISDTSAPNITFTVTIWDRNEMNSSNIDQVTATVSIEKQSDSESDDDEKRNISCGSRPAEIPISTKDIDPIYKESGTLLDVTCRFSSYEITRGSNNTPPGTMVATTMNISDLGHSEEACTVNVTWLFRVL